jgi:hypothetical protein
MGLSQYIFASSRPYTSLLREVNIRHFLIKSKHLAFNMQQQTQSNWCWAATSTSVSHFYWFFSTWTQCKVANAELGHTDCCTAPVPSPCNVPWYLDRALTRTNNFVSISGPATFAQVRAEIDAGRPVGARVGWSGGGGHFMVIYGYSIVLGVEYLDIDDPIYGKSHITLDEFSHNYQGSGTWTHTYLTKSYFKMPIKFYELREPILHLIWEKRPLLQVKNSLILTGKLQEALQENTTTVGTAHRVHILGLDALATGSTPDKTHNFVRVFETEKGAPSAFFDVNDGDAPRVIQMSTATQPLKLFSKGIEQALTQIERNNVECELKILKIPALNFEAVWADFDGAEKDFVVPLYSVGKLEAHKPVALDEAMAGLQESARALVNMDDTMGA